MTHHTPKPIGYWSGGRDTAAPEPLRNALNPLLRKPDQPVFIVLQDGATAVISTGSAMIGHMPVADDTACPLLAYAPPLHPASLGDPDFKKAYGLRFAYLLGAMANGIASTEMVTAAAKSGMLGFFGAGGLSLDQIQEAVDRIQHNCGELPYGFNLIHSPHDPDLEMGTVQLYLDRGVRLVEAAAFMRLTLPLVYYRIKGIHTDTEGRIICPNRVIGKISRIEVARQFFSPPPEKILKQLLARQLITDQEAALARRIPVADAMTAEADSGGHTDNRPALSLLPTIMALKDEMMDTYKYDSQLWVGLGGGIATPESTAAAFAMGAAYVLTGTVNQACLEAGTSEVVREMLAEAGQADVIMAPAADMFEMGVKVQVLKRGTMFPVRAAKLYDFYTRYESLEAIPAKERALLEKSFFKTSIEAEWQQTRAFFQRRDPRQIERAENEPKHKMALVFRSYLGRSSNWAVSGDPDRKIDYQIWCGPAIGAFNEWVKGSFLEKPENRSVVTVAMNLMLGATLATRAAWLRNQGIRLPDNTGHFSPLPPDEIEQLIKKGLYN